MHRPVRRRTASLGKLGFAFVFRIAIAAVHGTAFSRLERDFAFLAAVRTGRFEHLARSGIKRPAVIAVSEVSPAVMILHHWDYPF